MSSQQSIVKRLRRKAAAAGVELWYDRSCFTWYLFDDDCAGNEPINLQAEVREEHFQDLADLIANRKVVAAEFAEAAAQPYPIKIGGST